MRNHRRVSPVSTGGCGGIDNSGAAPCGAAPHRLAINPEIRENGREDRCERNPGRVSFVFNQPFFRTSRSSEKRKQLGEKAFSPSCAAVLQVRYAGSAVSSSWNRWQKMKWPGSASTHLGSWAQHSAA